MLQSLFVFNYFLEEAVGEGLPCFPGYIHWICDEMTPCYELMMLVLPLYLTHDPYASHTSSVPFPVFSAHHRPSLCSLTHHLSSLCLIRFVCTHNLPLSTITYPLLSSVAQLCPTLCDPMDRSTPGLPVHHQLPEFTQTHVHRVSDAIQPSHPLSSLSPPVPNPS